MSTAALFWIHAATGSLLFLLLCLHGRLTARVFQLFSRTPLITSQLPLPRGVDLRAVLENPRLFYFSLAVSGTVLRILLGVVLFLGLDVWAGGRPAALKALLVFAGLTAAEIFARISRPRASAPIGNAVAWTLRLIGSGIRLFPAVKETERPGPDALSGAVVSTVDGQEVFDPVAKRFLGGLLRLKHTTVGQAMIPRSRMVTVNEDWSIARAARVGTDRQFTRIPVAGDDGEISRLVHMKDVLVLLHSNQSGAFIKSIARDVQYVPTTQRLDSLLRQFQTQRVHIAVARDEYGDAVGLITMDDILRVALAHEASV